MLALLRNLIFAGLGLVLVACGSDSDPVAKLRVVHGVADAPRVNVYLDDVAVLEDVDFRTASPFLNVAAGTYDIRVEAIVPSGNLDVITANDFVIAAGSATTIAAVGDVSGDSVAPLVLPEPTDAIATSQFRLQVTHGSVDVGPVWLALTTPNAPIGQAVFAGPLAYTETFSPDDIDVGRYQVRVVARDPLQGDAITDADVVFDSGELALTSSADLHVLAVTSTVPNTVSPISLVAMDGRAAADEPGSSDVFDARTGSFLTIVHDIQTVPAVDVFADDKTTPAVEEIQLANDLVFGTFEPRQIVPASEYTVGVRLASDNSADAFAFDADLMAAMGYTVLARLAPVSNLPEAQILVDDYRSVATEAKVRLVHGSPSAGVVDIYVYATDAQNPSVPGDGGELLLLEDVEYGVDTGFLSLDPAQTYDVFVTTPNQPDSVALSVPGLAVDAGGVYTAIVRDPAQGESTFGVILIAD